ncbi:hypothetical protein H6G97_36470 [Nostoc flagelliforme FACHB-838]|uniref:Uncharacterized protein n=1 Tax=Nostoc flagelliforme FACHB-838 TaxID=2692904 RepID=A0ABR8DZT9_9NOSO|nr:hypothetical protein [Nostoc flagelliforme]MBD2534678.1 hypothetical protein [Nostoc flagelliforme FACHB-838]
MTLLNFKSEINFTEYAGERTPNFTGRAWVFQKIYDWLSNSNGSRYFLLTGEPGSGETAIINYNRMALRKAQMYYLQGFHHFGKT